jgi:RNA polymerase sigma factor (sigma-70 family)
MFSSKAQAVPMQGEACERASHAAKITAAELYDRYLPDVYRYVWQRVAGVDEAEDIVAEVFVAAAAGLPRFRGQCPPYLWLLSIARRQIALARRRRTTRRETLASELAADSVDADALWEQALSLAGRADPGPEVALMQTELRRVLDALVAELSPDQREAMMLQYMEELSVAEIAVVMGRSPGSVSNLLNRARTALYRRGRAYFLGDDEEQKR